MEGYRVVLRIEEIWPLLARAQSFPNWFTKLLLVLLKLNSCLDFAVGLMFDTLMSNLDCVAKEG